MGLDNIWMKQDGKTDTALTFDPPLRLEPGFPALAIGRCYFEFIEFAAGADLFGDLDNEEVRRVAACLGDVALVTADLARMFKAYGEAGYVLVASH